MKFAEMTNKLQNICIFVAVVLLTFNDPTNGVELFGKFY